MTYRPLFIVLGGLALASCGHSAASFGLTGAPEAAPPVPPSDATIGMPGIQTGGAYAPTLMPTTGGDGRYYGAPE